MASETATRSLDLVSVGEGDTVVIVGAAGAVGSTAVQIAVARGARVNGAAREGDHEYLVHHQEMLLEAARAAGKTPFVACLPPLVPGEQVDESLLGGALTGYGSRECAVKLRTLGTWAKASVDAGECSDGLTTNVQPAASAGASFQVISSSGEFHGVIAPTTPTGSRRV